MGEKLTSNTFKQTPVIAINSKEGGKFKGKILTTGKEVNLSKGKGVVFEFEAHEVEGLEIQVKNEVNGKYESTDINENEKVSIFAPAGLQRSLSKAKIDDIITIVYKGKDENGYHIHDVERD